MRTKKKILSLLLAIAMIAGLLPWAAVPAYAAGSQQIRILGSDNAWTTYTLGTDTLPTGLSYDAASKRIVMNNYSGKAIQALGTESDYPKLEILVKGTNTLTGGTAANVKDTYALACENGSISLTGEGGATLSITPIQQRQ
mgnify:CR=1 FL=1